MTSLVEKSFFLFLLGFKMQMKMSFMVLEIWLLVLKFFKRSFVRAETTIVEEIFYQALH